MAKDDEDGIDLDDDKEDEGEGDYDTKNDKTWQWVGILLLGGLAALAGHHLATVEAHKDMWRKPDQGRRQAARHPYVNPAPYNYQQLPEIRPEGGYRTYPRRLVSPIYYDDDAVVSRDFYGNIVGVYDNANQSLVEY